MAQSSMDRFVVRSTSAHSRPTSSLGSSRLRQATIEDLRGVVVVEEIERLKSLLECETQTPDDLLDALNKLRRKIPSREVLLRTKVGVTLNALRRHGDPEVARLAKEIRAEWKLYFKNKLSRPMIEVRSDEKTEGTRRNARRMLAAPLGLEETHNIPEAIEREVFGRNKRLLNGPYKRTIRALTMALKNRDGVAREVQTGVVGIRTFVDAHEKTS